MLSKSSNTPEKTLHKVQKFTYAQCLEESTITGNGFYILLPPTIPGQFKVVRGSALDILHLVRYVSPTTFLAFSAARITRILHLCLSSGPL